MREIEDIVSRIGRATPTAILARRLLKGDEDVEGDLADTVVCIAVQLIASLIRARARWRNQVSRRNLVSHRSFSKCARYHRARSLFRRAGSDPIQDDLDFGIRQFA